MKIGLLKKVAPMDYQAVGPDAQPMTLEKQLDQAKASGVDGIYFYTPMLLSPTLDGAQLDDCAAMAREKGLYLDVGVGSVNPFNTTERETVWALTGGDYLAGMEKMLRAGVRLGCRDLIACCAGQKAYRFQGWFTVDRFRTDVDWEDQLKASENFLKRLAPVLRDIGARIALETHEELTSFEVARLIEAVGPDVLSCCLDTGNVVSRGEDPLAAARRVAPYVTQMHAKDCIVYFSPDGRGLRRQIKPCGQGIVNFPEIFKLLAANGNDIHVQIEDHKGAMRMEIFDPAWNAHHPDMQLDEVLYLVKMACRAHQDEAAGRLPNIAAYEQEPYEAQRSARMHQAIEYLKQFR